MTTEKAIELLHRISDSQFDGPHGDERREALSMAVRALEGDGDTISRKMAIDEVKRLHDVAWANWKETRISANTMIDALKDLPSAQPETHDKRTETHACDLINRQQAIDAIADGLKGIFVEYRDIAEKMIGKLPPAQPERKTGQLLYHHTEDIDEERTADVYFCSTCKEEVLKKIRFGMFSGELDIYYGYCPHCGARMDGESDE